MSKLPPPIISWSKKGNRCFIVLYNKKTEKYHAGYTKFNPKLVFPSKSKCFGDSPELAISSLQKFLDANIESLPINNKEKYGAEKNV